MTKTLFKYVMTTLVGLSLVACKTDDMIVLHGNDTGTEKTFERLVVMPAEGAFKSSLPVGVQQAFVAIAEYSDKTTLDVTPNIQWKSSNIESGTIDKGVLTTLKAGLTSVSASYNEHTSNQVDITVIDAALVSIQLTPAIKSTPLGQTVTMTAAAAFEGGITGALNGGTWISGTPEVATVSTDGLVTPVAEGATTITVTKGDIEATAEITVTAAELVSIALTPDAPSTPLGQTIQMSAMGTFTEGEPEELTGVSWTSGTLGVATVSTSGLVTPVSPGTTTITVTKGDIHSTAEITVTAAELISVALQQPVAATMEALTFQMVAMGTFTDGSEHVITGGDWISSQPSTAVVSHDGVVTGVKAGKSTIYYHASAQFHAQSSFEVFPRIATVEWSPETVLMLANAKIQVRNALTYELKDAAGMPIDHMSGLYDGFEWPDGTIFKLRAEDYFADGRFLKITRLVVDHPVAEEVPHTYWGIEAPAPYRTREFNAVLEINVPSGVQGEYRKYEISTPPTEVYFR